MAKARQTPTTAKGWKRASGPASRTRPTPIQVPSGNTALLVAPGVENFITQGLIPNSLLTIVQGQIEEARTGKKMSEEEREKEMEESFAKMLEDPQKLKDVFALADAVALACVVKPELLPVPEKPEDRKEGNLYVDEVDLEDKLFIMQYAMGGTTDLKSFRDELGEGVGSVRPGEDVAS